MAYVVLIQVSCLYLELGELSLYISKFVEPQQESIKIGFNSVYYLLTLCSYKKVLAWLLLYLCISVLANTQINQWENGLLE